MVVSTRVEPSEFVVVTRETKVDGSLDENSVAIFGSVYSTKESGGSYGVNAPGITTCVIGSTVTEPRLLVTVISVTSVVGPVGAGPGTNPVPTLSAPGIHVGNLTVTTDWAKALVGRSPSANAPLRYFILRERLKTRESGYSNIKDRRPLQRHKTKRA